MFDIKTQTWYSFLTDAERQLIDTSFQLLAQINQDTYTDYSFIVFPMAKAYEGFLKTYLLDLGLISQHVYESRRFRIGRALNPDINNGQRDDLWLFDDVARVCGLEMAREMWDAWIECRNQVFHFFPLQHQQLTHAAAQAKLHQIAMAMDGAVRCHTNAKMQMQLQSQHWQQLQ